MGKDQEIIQEYFTKYYSKKDKYIYNEFIIETAVGVLLLLVGYFLLKKIPLNAGHVGEILGNKKTEQELNSNIDYTIEEIKKSKDLNEEQKNDYISKLQEYKKIFQIFKDDFSNLKENLETLKEEELITEEQIEKIFSELKDVKNIDDKINLLDSIRKKLPANASKDVINKITLAINNLNNIKSSYNKLSKAEKIIITLAKLTNWEWLWKLLVRKNPNESQEIIKETLKANEETITKEEIKVDVNSEEGTISTNDSGEATLKFKEVNDNNVKIEITQNDKTQDHEITSEETSKLLNDEKIKLPNTEPTSEVPQEKPSKENKEEKKTERKELNDFKNIVSNENEKVNKAYKVDFNELNDSRIKILETNEDSDFYIKLTSKKIKKDENIINFELYYFNKTDKQLNKLNDTIVLAEASISSRLKKEKSTLIYEGKIIYNKTDKKIIFTGVKKKTSIINKISNFLSGGTKKVPKEIQSIITSDGKVDLNKANSDQMIQVINATSEIIGDEPITMKQLRSILFKTKSLKPQNVQNVPNITPGDTDSIKKAIGIFKNRSNVFKIDLESGELEQISNFSKEEFDNLTDCIVFYQKDKQKDKNIHFGQLKLKNINNIDKYSDTIQKYFEFNKSIITEANEAKKVYEDFISAIPCKVIIKNDLFIYIDEIIEKGQLSTKKIKEKIKDNVDLKEKIKEIISKAPDSTEVTSLEPEGETIPSEEKPVGKIEPSAPEVSDEKKESVVQEETYFLSLEKIIDDDTQLSKKVDSDSGGIILTKKKDLEYKGILWIKDNISKTIDFSKLKKLSQYFNISIYDYILNEAFEIKEYQTGFVSDFNLTVKLVILEGIPVISEINTKGNLQKNKKDELVKGLQDFLRKEIGINKEDPEYQNKKAEVYNKIGLKDFEQAVKKEDEGFEKTGVFYIQKGKKVGVQIVKNFNKLSTLFNNKEQYKLFYYINNNDEYYYINLDDNIVSVLNLLKNNKKVKFKNEFINVEDFIDIFKKDSILFKKFTNFDKNKIYKNNDITFGKIKEVKELQKGKIKVLSFILPTDPSFQPKISESRQGNLEAEMSSYNFKNLDSMIINEVFKRWKK